MKITQLSIKNFRSIKESSYSLKSFNCIVGHNNAGKSTTLIAISLITSNTSLKPSDFYDQTMPVEIKVELEITEASCFDVMPPEHSERIKQLIRNNRLSILKRYSPSATPEVLCAKLIPRDKRFSDSNISDRLKSVKNPTKIKEALIAEFPELQQQIEEAPIESAQDTKRFISKILEAFDESHFDQEWVKLPTGIPQSISLILPSVIYIPAVKDISDEIKSKEASSLGKIVRILLEMIEETDAINTIRDSFKQLNGFLNRLDEGDKLQVDNRLNEIREIERSVELHIREQFDSAQLRLQIPPPELKTILGNARLILDDGIATDVEQKGDGMKRAVLFALIRTLVKLSRTRKVKSSFANYLFLFEEPELYLHPQSQRVLFDALNQLSKEHQVVVCTHSPYFLTPSNDGALYRLMKSRVSPDKPPQSRSINVGLHTIDDKTAFQIICFENSSAAFFSDRVLLVEGDSEIIYIKHIASILNERWNFDNKNISIVKVHGKGNFAKFRKFFNTFEVEVKIIADLDVICKDFQHLGASESAKDAKDLLMAKARKIHESKGGDYAITAKQAKRLTGRYSFIEKYQRCKSLSQRLSRGEILNSDEYDLFTELFSEESSITIYDVIKSHPETHDLKVNLLDQLRNEGIVVLSRGAIEEYYPPDAQGDDKPTKAMSAQSKVLTKTDALKLSDVWHTNDNRNATELELAFQSIFTGLD